MQAAKKARSYRGIIKRAIVIVSVFILFIWPGYITNLIFYKNVGKYANLFTQEWISMKPECLPLKEYVQTSEKYWQFYGYQYDENLDPKTLESFLKVTATQQSAITDIHSSLKTVLSDDNSLFRGFNDHVQKMIPSRGVVYVSGPEYYSLTMLSIKYIRSVLLDGIPIQIFVPYKRKDDQHCNKIQMVFNNVECVYFDQYLSESTLSSLKGYQYKSLALLMSKFTDTLYLDSDNIPLIQPTRMFKSSEYKEHGMVSWPDFWKRSTHYKFYSMAGIESLGQTITTTPSVEAGQILINKKTHLKTLLLAHYYNVWGPYYFYPLFNQGFPGQGDKDTFYLASRVVSEGSYLMTGVKTKSFGFKAKQSLYHGQGILQRSPDDDTFWFLHLNEPKLLVDKMIKSSYFSSGIKSAWKVMRYAQKSSANEWSFRQVFGDLEYKIWKLLDELLSKDFRGFQVYKDWGNDEAADYVRQRVKVLQYDN